MQVRAVFRWDYNSRAEASESIRRVPGVRNIASYLNTSRIEPNIDVIGPIRSSRFSCPSTRVSVPESTAPPLPP